MVSLSLPKRTATGDGLRPVNLRTDLAPLADLIEIAFADSMDGSGRSAVREMRSLSRMRPTMHILLGVNDLIEGISLGYVWIADGKLVGNVSIYPADIPSSLGRTWIIANVAVHPDYRGRGIATELMRASMDTIRRKGVATILQVDAHNHVAQHLYERLGFVRERAWTHWRRSSALRVPPPFAQRLHITRRRDDEWRAEMELAARVRPADLGGLGWQRPLHERYFRSSLIKTLNNWISLRSLERLVVRSDDEQRLLAAMWIESAFAAATVQLTLMSDPENADICSEALLNLTVRRFGARSPLTLEHPADDESIRGLLPRFGFHAQRTLLHMHWEIHA